MTSSTPPRSCASPAPACSTSSTATTCSSGLPAHGALVEHVVAVDDAEHAATILRFTRAGVLDVINSNYVLYQRAMGMPPGLIVWKYVLRNALISTVTQIGLIFGVLVTNAVVVETVFDWP